MGRNHLPISLALRSIVLEYEATGLFYEEFEEGRAWKTAARTIGESDVLSAHRCGGGGQDAFRGKGGPRAARAFLSHGPGDQTRDRRGDGGGVFGLGVAFSRSDLLRRYDFRRGRREIKAHLQQGAGVGDARP